MPASRQIKSARWQAKEFEASGPGACHLLEILKGNTLHAVISPSRVQEIVCDHGIKTIALRSETGAFKQDHLPLDVMGILPDLCTLNQGRQLPESAEIRK